MFGVKEENTIKCNFKLFFRGASKDNIPDIFLWLGCISMYMLNFLLNKQNVYIYIIKLYSFMKQLNYYIPVKVILSNSFLQQICCNMYFSI